MGNKQSSPAPPPPPPQPAAPPPPPPPTPAQQCALSKVQLNQIQADLTSKQTQVDTCDPQGAQARLTNAAMAANNDYVYQKRSKFNELLQANTAATTIYYNVRDAVAPILTVGTEVTDQQKRLLEENRKYTRAQRKERRTFLDNDPSVGVGGAPAVRTSDDKVLLFFWITFGLALLIALVYLLNVFGTGMDMKQKAMIGATVVFVSYGLVYFLLAQYG